MMPRIHKPLTALALGGALLAWPIQPAVAQTDQAERSGQLEEDKQLLTEAVKVVDQMTDDPELAVLMHKAKGVYLIPNFGRAGLIIGGRGGDGVAMFQRNGEWSNPAFFNFGAVSFGLQAGASGGSAAFLLMTEESLDEFQEGNVFSINAEAGLTIIDYSENAQASYGKGDIIFWTNTEGAYAGASASLSDIAWDDDSNAALYGPDADAADVLGGKAEPKASVEAMKLAMTEIPAGEGGDHQPPTSERKADVPIQGLADTDSGAVEPAVVSSAQLRQFGKVLVDGAGHPLYLFEGDDQGANSSDCDRTCADDWPPLLTNGEPKVQGDAQAGLVSTIEREGRTKQVTYNGWPLYRYVMDVGGGEQDALGHEVTDFESEWYLVTPEGKRAEID
jgi:lipid-binding SYLF domain-containing protein/predicted lipoprotein with Yx(FWY)xxD motif